MEIEFDAYYKTEKGNIRIVNGVLTNADIEDAILIKLDIESFDGHKAKLDSVSLNGVNL